MKLEFKSVLFLGIGGVSMHQLALAIKKMGINVLGYDAKPSKYTKICEENGIKVTNVFSRDFLNVDLCIKTGAIKENNKFFQAVKKLGIKVLDRAEALAMLTTEFKTVIAVAGTHGKSTTAALIYEMLRVSGKNVSCHIGADIYAPRFNLGDEFLVVEACEYNRSFLSLKPDISVVTNIEEEHMDCYGSLFNLRNAFTTFLRRGEKRFVMLEDSTKFLRRRLKIEFVKKISTTTTIKLKGEYNLKNISLAIQVAKSIGATDEAIKTVLETFAGVPRRYEFLGKYKQTKIFIDYAHHPTEISQFVKTFAENNKNFLIVFQPHTYSRTKRFLDDFVGVFSKLNNIIIFKEYPAREKPCQGMSAKELFFEIQKVNDRVEYCSKEKYLISKLQDFDEVAFVGAGDIDLIARNIIKTN